MPKRIIIADDKEQDRYLLKVLLEKSGYTVEEACDGAEALALARKNVPDMIVSDILMPVMDGFNLCREWRKDERLRTLPFVFYTATYTDPRDEDLALKMGADKFIVKPTEPAVLLKLLSETLSVTTRESLSIQEFAAVPEKEFYRQYSESLVRKLEDKLELFRVIFDTDPGMILLLSPSFTVLEINRAASALFGLRGETAINLNFVDRIIISADREAFAEKLSGVMSGLQVRDIECGVSCDGGLQRIARWNAHPVKHVSGGTEGILLVGIDITDSKRAELVRRDLEKQLRHAQRMEAIGVFASGIAHDLNNILTGLFCYVEMVQYELPQDSQNAENLSKALGAADRAKDLVSQILSISRRSEGSLELVDVVQIAKEVGHLLKASIPARIAIQVEAEEDVGLIKADPTQIHQVLMNLGTNAYHAFGSLGGSIVISCRSHSENGRHTLSHPLARAGEYACIEIRDTGCGMSKSTMERMFDPYFTTKEKGLGTGLGLSVVKAIVEAHLGWIDCESQVGEGTTFRVYLPKSQEPGAVSQKKENRKWKFGNGESVLLVEDDETNGPMLLYILTELGYQVVLAHDGREAMELFVKSPSSFDLIVTDLNMPFMGGIELAQKVLLLNPELPIMLLSGSVEGLTDQYVRSKGIAVYVRKPFSIQDLSRVLREVLESAAVRKSGNATAGLEKI